MDLWAEILLVIAAAFAVLSLSGISNQLARIATELEALRLLVQGEAEIGRAEQARLN
jgi:uncharacterized membrane protein YtjA (UPF0391 family)